MVFKIPKKRPGRKSLSKGGGVTPPCRIRLTEKQIGVVGEIIAEGKASNLSEAIRYLLDTWKGD